METPGVVTYAFHCAQLEGAATERVINSDPKKRRARMVMEHFPCNGKLHITLNPEVTDAARIHIEHHLPHQHYVDISLTDEMKDIIEEMKDSPASMVNIFSLCPCVIYLWLHRSGQGLSVIFLAMKLHRTRYTLIGHH